MSPAYTKSVRVKTRDGWRSATPTEIKIARCVGVALGSWLLVFALVCGPQWLQAATAVLYVADIVLKEARKQD